MPNVEPVELYGPAPGELPTWVRRTIVVASLVTLAGAFIVPHAIWHFATTVPQWPPRQFEPAIGRFWFCDAPALAVGLVLVVLYMRRYQVSWLAHVAVALPLIHLGLLVFVAAAGSHGAPQETPVLERYPIALAFAMLAVVSVGVAFVVARRRQREVLQALAMFTLTQLVFMATWLPFVANLYNRSSLRRPEITPSMTLLAVALPAILAGVFTAWAIRYPEIVRSLRWWLLGGLLLWCYAFDLRSSAEADELYFHANHEHFVAIAGALAAASLVALAIAARLRPRGVWREATIAGDGDHVGCVQITSWLRGPTTLLRACELETPEGPVPVASGRLVGELPIWTMSLRTGEAMSVLRAGDRVRVRGLVEAGGDHPFRASSALVPGSAGLDIAPTATTTTASTQMALALWRPCVAYLVIVVIVALPALYAAWKHQL